MIVDLKKGGFIKGFMGNVNENWPAGQPHSLYNTDLQAYGSSHTRLQT